MAGAPSPRCRRLSADRQSEKLALREHERNQLGGVARTCLAQQVFSMFADGLVADAELLCNLLAGAACDQQSDELPLSGGKRLKARHGFGRA